MTGVSNPIEREATTPRNHWKGISTCLAVSTLLGACAAPVVTETRVYGEATSVTPAAYVEFGTVQSIEVQEIRQPTTGGGAVLGGLIGGIVGNQVGHGFGRGAATALGAVGGAVVGNEAEHNNAAAHRSSRYRVAVRFDDGLVRVFEPLESVCVLNVAYWYRSNTAQTELQALAPASPRWLKCDTNTHCDTATLRV